MLKLKNISKTYETGEIKVEALKDINLEFRKSEFVAILGPSGCGKTTLLNIVGGLDRYTSGDLEIGGVSTKDYKDKDWDTYRNHSVGFVFQSYNLIPHQTVLENVELALTLSGVSKEERRKKAQAVLEKVGLGDKLKAKPNQLSGGQMQRVAIARALVNDPEIILADEPTGALDSTSSLQVMEILKEISKDRLIIMVTHNPELANKYSTRIVNLLDGELTSDSNPYNSEEKGKTEKVQEKSKKKRMSFFTALSLSLKNLLTKKARTALVSFAGSIGIIGIALILAISSGFSTYINKMQEDTLSSNPISIEAKNVDFSSLITAMFLDNSESKNVEHDRENVYPNDSITSIMGNVGNNLKSNNLKKFHTYLNQNIDQIEDNVTGIKYTYDLDFEFYTMDNNNVQPSSNAPNQMIVKYALFYLEKNANVEIEAEEIGGVKTGSYIIKAKQDTDYTFFDKYDDLEAVKQSLISTGKVKLSSTQVYLMAFSVLGFGGAISFSGMRIFSEMLDNKQLIEEQYELLGWSRFVENSNEALLVLDKNNEVDDYALYALGLTSEEEMDKTLRALVNGEKYQSKITYDEILGKEYKVLLESDYFVEIDGEIVDFRVFANRNNIAFDLSKYNMYYKQALDNCDNKLKIVGIVRLNETTENGTLSTGIAYSYDFTKNMIAKHNQSLAVTSGEIDALSLDNPASINIYFNTFESKELVEEFIDNYNKTAENGDEISYTDYAGMIMSTVSVIINAITYVLIAFVGVSLIVSSIMIGIITYISVLERTKEIGVLRSIGASKKDVSRVFTAESFIIGLTSGVLGILISLMLTIPINILLKHFTNISSLASLPVLGSIILIVISISLTLIAGLIPSKIAAKKDPVVALRSN